MFKTLTWSAVSAACYSVSRGACICGAIGFSVLLAFSGSAFLVLALHCMSKHNTMWRRRKHEEGTEATCVR